jgi:hypothetical protein
MNRSFKHGFTLIIKYMLYLLLIKEQTRVSFPMGINCQQEINFVQHSALTIPTSVTDYLRTVVKCFVETE